MLTPESITGGERKMIGSAFVLEAENIEEVRKIVEDDIYFTAGVVSFVLMIMGVVNHKALLLSVGPREDCDYSIRSCCRRGVQRCECR